MSKARGFKAIASCWRLGSGLLRRRSAVLLLFALFALAPRVAAQPQAVQYNYDSLNRLVSAQYPDRLIRYTYDPAGNRLTLSIERVNPLPTLTTILPSSALVGGVNLAVTVSGTGFVDTSVVNWNGISRLTTFVSQAQLTAAIDAADVATLGTADITVMNPSPGGGVTSALPFSIVAACTFSVSPTTQAVAAAGGPGSVSVATPAGCSWDAVADQQWILVNSNASGSGPATVGYAVASNPSSVSRSGHITVAGEVHTINQAGATCTFTVVASPNSFTSTGGSGVATVTAGPSDCSWTALASSPWITFSGNASGVGNGAVGFDVAPNPSTVPRNGSVTVGGQAAAIAQDGKPVILTVTKAGSGSGTVVSTPAGIDCGASCIAAFVAGQQVTLTANPDPGSLFDQWTGDPDCADGAVTLDADMQCTADFLTDTLGNPVPFISAVTPLAVVPGSAGVTLSADGANIHPTSVLRWNGVDHASTAVTSTHIEAQITGPELAAGVTAIVAVWTPGPGGGLSNEVLVHVATPSPGLEFFTSTAGTGAEPVGVAAADVNGDGNPDVVSANMLASSVSVVLGGGGGTFGAKTDFATGNGPSAVQVADLNRDTRGDLITTNYLANTISVLMGNGDGTFGVATHFPTGLAPFASATADFDADGALDVVVANSGSTSISILLGKGDGTFRPAVDYATSSAPQGVVAGDFDGDGTLDVVTAEAGGALSVFPGVGDGTFGATATFVVGQGARGLSAGDFNADGALDLLTANEIDNTVSILLGDGAGAFGPNLDIVVGTSPRAVTVGDVNADTKLDALVSNSGSNSISVLLGNGDGTFVPRRDFAAGSGPVSMAPADFDRDGRLDLAVANQATNMLSVLVGRLPAAVSISPSAIDFGQRGIGAPTISRTITLTSSGASPLNISSVVLVSGAVSEFQVMTDGCSGTPIAPGGICAVTVRYLAAGAGVASADLRVSSNALGAPHAVTLSGEAVPPSTVSGFSPLSGAPGTSVTISGTALAGATAVNFNGLAATFSVSSATAIAATVPPGATSGPITVTTPLNDATSAAAFQVAPRIAGILPGSGAVGTVVTITGANFLTTNNTVKFGAGYIRNLPSPDGITLQFAVPDGLDLCAPDAVGPCPGAYPPVTPGDYTIVVMSGAESSNSVTFTVTP